jgi:hypothetical protein
MKINAFFRNIYFKNLLAAILIFLVLVVAVLTWLNIYTHHGESVEIPNVKGLQIEEVAPIFANKKLYYQIIDSIFDKNAVPGSIVRTVPPAGSKVKEGRTIYITTNSVTAQLITIPDVKDLSQRQAISMLKSIGFERINIKSVSGVHRDLVIGLESRGLPMEAGMRATASTPLMLLVCSGNDEYIFMENSDTIVDISPAESWF